MTGTIVAREILQLQCLAKLGLRLAIPAKSALAATAADAAECGLCKPPATA